MEDLLRRVRHVLVDLLPRISVLEIAHELRAARQRHVLQARGDDERRRRAFWPWLVALVFVLGAIVGGYFLYDQIQQQLSGSKTIAVESYLDHHAGKLGTRFDPGSYVLLTETMNSWDVGRGRGG